ncbi:hypothetical protein [Mycobacterium sp. Marseille-P9652]|uniref:hypothetical protein n=1 Tax=Mycobacterium sp. Marseille-P9652 TaxID=2654950 RepID=UPI0012E89646|nr:hypothetical protein [Mycobacterium sp. Marseille-P9652]
MAEGLSEQEAALRKLPLPYSLAMRLRDAGVARSVICEYVGVAEASLDGFFHIAEEKLAALQQRCEPSLTEGIRDANSG